ncbi:unnamed protein product [Didymodactylos carnosus]|uniref:Uncharacterized protein n=1 Tax=Didymodactylos carnosus TaxID=1234261 RepID=A0A813V6W4_9BILA|nr:unnamed protein product [Didymodactylos carnosus]CAF1064766.1 unnamed protein product [Didymodactylos carnosus]CAF3624061.1 unnamed protein product [Didymodactylos carnosus]CAF3829865.1 unnamed protein product [Didymodactylos carnosus]
MATKQISRLLDKVAIVTASTDGIGYAIAKRLASEGAKVVVSSRKKENVTKAIKQLEKDKLQVFGTSCHVGNSDDRTRLFKETIDKYGRLDILVANAGISPYVGSLLETSESVWDKVFEINVKSTFFLIKEAVPYLEKQKDSSIIIVSSIAGYMPFDVLGAYSISKTTLLGMTKALSTSCATKGIRVNCIAPGIIKTKFSRTLWDDGSNNTSDTTETEQCALRRVGTADECAGTVAFLASNDASYITGETITITGGMQKSIMPYKLSKLGSCQVCYDYDGGQQENQCGCCGLWLCLKHSVEHQQFCTESSPLISNAKFKLKLLNEQLPVNEYPLSTKFGVGMCASDQHILVYEHPSVLVLFNKHTQISRIEMDDLDCVEDISWCVSMNVFLVLCAKSLSIFNPVTFEFNVIKHVKPFNDGDFYSITNYQNELYISYVKNIFVEHRSLPSFTLLSRVENKQLLVDLYFEHTAEDQRGRAGIPQNYKYPPVNHNKSLRVDEYPLLDCDDSDNDCYLQYYNSIRSTNTDKESDIVQIGCIRNNGRSIAATIKHNSMWTVSLFDGKLHQTYWGASLGGHETDSGSCMLTSLFNTNDWLVLNSCITPSLLSLLDETGQLKQRITVNAWNLCCLGTKYLVLRDDDCLRLYRIEINNDTNSDSD